MDAKDEVERAEVQREAVDGEVLIMDRDVNNGANTGAALMITIGD